MTTTDDVLYPATGECVERTAYTAVLNKLTAAASTYSEPVEITGLYTWDNYAKVTFALDGREFDTKLPVTLNKRVLRCEIVQALRDEASEVCDGMDAQELFGSWWASLTNGHEDTDDVEVMARITADVTERVIQLIEEDTEYYGALLRATERLANAAI
ncbi:MAG TPA: hypothetical protein K8W03_01290 [Bifidobacterium pseudolongum subsp. globosum]|nr:hypothetical protein [Bifidobacterium pseudolongum subsp. globosum]